MANIVPPANPTEYREMTMVLNPVLGPNVAMNPQHAAPMAVNATMAAMADLNERKKKA